MSVEQEAAGKLALALGESYDTSTFFGDEGWDLMKLVEVVTAQAGAFIRPEIPDETIAVLARIADRRTEQHEKGFTRKADDKKGLKHLLEVADTYNYAIHADGPTEARDALINQITTLVAAVEVIDRDILRSMNNG